MIGTGGADSGTAPATPTPWWRPGIVAAAVRRLTFRPALVLPVGFSVGITLTGQLTATWALWAEGEPVSGHLVVEAADLGANPGSAVQEMLRAAVWAALPEADRAELWWRGEAMCPTRWPLHGRVRHWFSAEAARARQAVEGCGTEHHRRLLIAARERTFTAAAVLDRRIPAQARVHAPIAFALPTEFVASCSAPLESARGWHTVAVDGSARPDLEPRTGQRVGGWAAVTDHGLVTYGTAPGRAVDAELTALVRGLALFPAGARVRVLCDNATVITAVQRAYQSPGSVRRLVAKYLSPAALPVTEQLQAHLARLAAVRMVQVAGSASPQAAGAEPDHASSPTGSALVPAPGPVLVSAPARVPVHRLHVVADVVAASYTYAIRFPSVPARVVRELLRQAALSGDRSWITSRRPLLRAIAAAQGFDDRTEAAVPCAPSETERLHS